MPSIHYETDRVTVWHGDCLDVLRDLPDSSVDAIVTDPPYGLANTTTAQVAETLTAWIGGDRTYIPSGAGFMGKSWDAFVPPVAVWDECLRVLKPGGHALVFAGARTNDLMGLALRLAGFEIRDAVMWVYASGFPKSLDVSKAIDKAGGDPLSFRRFARAYAKAIEDRAPLTHADVDRHLGIKASSCYWAREDHRGGLPPRHHWEALVDLLALPDSLVTLYDEAEREVIGERETGRGTGRGAVAYIGDSDNRDVTAPATPAAQQWQGWGTALKPAFEPIVVARKPLAGTVAANVLAHGTGALNIDGCRVAAPDGSPSVARRESAARSGNTPRGGAIMDDRTTPERYTEQRPGEALGRWPANLVLTHAPDCGPDDAPGECVEGCPVRELDEQSGTSTSTIAKPRGAASGDGWHMTATGAEYADSGGASRYFPSFRYEPKAGGTERPRHGGTAHPTVKPLDLMRWLVRLVTPPDGVVLEPFAGSGTTVEACILEGFRCIAVEREADYLPLIMDRVTKRTDPVGHLKHRASGGHDVDLGLFALLDGEPA